MGPKNNVYLRNNYKKTSTESNLNWHQWKILLILTMKIFT